MLLKDQLFLHKNAKNNFQGTNTHTMPALFTVAPYIWNGFLIYQNWENHCIMKKHPLTTKIWHQTNIVIRSGWLSTICILE